MASKFILNEHKKTAVLLIAPETGRLPDHMGPLARFISGKSGGLGDVITALCEGLSERGIECHLATLNLKRRFQQEGNLDDSQWHKIHQTVDPERIHLVTSDLFDELPGAYGGNPILNAAEFQKGVVNHVIARLRAKNGGRLIIHSHDWMAGGLITAYARTQGCPVLHTLHNVHTGHVPPGMFFGVNTEIMQDYLYLSGNNGNTGIDCQATAVKNANLINFVGRRFLKEILENHFIDHEFVPGSVRREVRIKYDHGSVLTILNAPARSMYPEQCSTLVRKYGPDDDVVRAKRENLVEFQKRTGLLVNPDAILLYWPSRLDPTQKGIELLEHIAHSFVIAHGDVQIAVIGNGVDGDRNHEEICGRIAWSSGGKIVYHRFDESLSMLGFAAASDVFGASLFEPCGQIDQVGNLYGATSTNRDTGGYHDKINELTLIEDGAPRDSGNGFLFQDYDPGGLWYGLAQTVKFHRRPVEVRAKHIRRIMKETRQKHDMDLMVARYVDTYERLNGGQPLA